MSCVRDRLYYANIQCGLCVAGCIMLTSSVPLKTVYSNITIEGVLLFIITKYIKYISSSPDLKSMRNAHVRIISVSL